jgi:hypothetical protein
VRGVQVQDALGEGATAWTVRARVVINATGVFCDAVRRLDQRRRPAADPGQPGRAPGAAARASCPATTRSWCRTPRMGACCSPCPGRIACCSAPPTRRCRARVDEPRPREEEIAYLLRHAARYLAAPRRSCRCAERLRGAASAVQRRGRRRHRGALARARHRGVGLRAGDHRGREVDHLSPHGRARLIDRAAEEMAGRVDRTSWRRSACLLCQPPRSISAKALNA